MSYDIFFINKKNMTSDEVDDFFETENTDFKISKDKKTEIVKELKNKNLKFEEVSEDDYTELNFETYQVSFSENQVAISLPYWEDNKTEKIGNEIKIICDTLEYFGMTGYDPQLGEVLNDVFDFEDMYSMKFGGTLDILEDYNEEENIKKENIKRGKKIIVISLIIIMLVVFWLM